MIGPPIQRRHLVDIFKGTAEIKEAMTVVGWIAINHARVEAALDYLLWQLRCFELSSRKAHQNKSEIELQALFRADKPKRSIVSTKVASVQKYLDHDTGRVASRLNSLEGGDNFAREWRNLGERIEDLSQKRNAVVHSAIGWSGLDVVRSPSWDTEDRLGVNLDRDQQLVADLGQLSIEVLSFATRVGQALPFRGNRIITA